jgi:hypothetical protein
MTAEFENKMNALQGHDVSPFKECLTAIEVAVHAHLIAKCEDIMNDDGVEALKAVTKNYQALADHIELQLPKHITKGWVPKACDLITAYHRFAAAKSKTNTHGFNKAFMVWKEYKLPATEKNDPAVGLIRSLLKGMGQAIMEHLQVQKAVINENAGALKALLKEYKGIARGMKDGTSWKEGLEPKISLKQLLNHAATPKTGLLSGNGAKVSAGRKSLTEVLSLAMHGGGGAQVSFVRLHLRTFRRGGADARSRHDFAVVVY